MLASLWQPRSTGGGIWSTPEPLLVGFPNEAVRTEVCHHVLRRWRIESARRARLFA